MEVHQLIKGCIREDEKCQRQFYEHFAPKMMVVCYRYAKNREEAEDILQEGFIKVFDNLNKFRFEGSLEGWVRRIMVNSAINKFRKKKLDFENIQMEEYEHPSKDPEAYHALNEKALLEMVASLPDGYRMVFNLFAIEGYSHKEISKKLGITEGTSRSQLVKARKALQEKVIRLESNHYERKAY